MYDLDQVPEPLWFLDTSLKWGKKQNTDQGLLKEWHEIRHTNYSLLVYRKHSIIVRCVCVCVCQSLSSLSYIQFFSAPRTVAHQVPLSMGFPRQEYWSEWSFPFPGDLPNPGIKPIPLVSPALAGGFFTTIATWEAQLLDRLLLWYLISILALLH